MYSSPFLGQKSHVLRAELHTDVWKGTGYSSESPGILLNPPPMRVSTVHGSHYGELRQVDTTDLQNVTTVSFRG